MERPQEISAQFSSTTRGFRVTVVPEFVEDESRIDDEIYAFRYNVQLENTGTSTAQLINRHWVITSGGKQIGDIKGEGVIGEQPILTPGDVHRYSSWCVIEDQVGSMHGTYTFFSDEGEFFDVEIPKFDLIYYDTSQLH